jgi:hypothetical protein
VGKKMIGPGGNSPEDVYSLSAAVHAAIVMTGFPGSSRIDLIGNKKIFYEGHEFSRKTKRDSCFSPVLA